MNSTTPVPAPVFRTTTHQSVVNLSEPKRSPHFAWDRVVENISSDEGASEPPIKKARKEQEDADRKTDIHSHRHKHSRRHLHSKLHKEQLSTLKNQKLLLESQIQNEDLKQRNEALTTELIRTTKELQQKKKTVGSAVQTYGEMDKKQEKSRATIKERNNEIEKLKEQIEILKNLFENKDIPFASLQITRKLQDSLESENKKLEEVTTQLRQAQKKWIKSTTLAHQEGERAVRAEASASELSRKWQQAEIHLKETESTLKETESKLKETKSTLKETKSTLKETKSTLKETKSTLKETKSELKATESERKETARALKEKTETAKGLQNLTIDFFNEKEALSHEKEALSHKISTLKNDLQAAHEALYEAALRND